MMILSTKPIATDNPRLVHVLWCTGYNKKGVLRVHLPTASSDSSLIAELCALRYLLFADYAFNVRTIDGKGIEVYSSCGAIKKLALGRSTKKAALPYARFLQVRLTELNYAVLRKNNILPDLNDTDLEWKDLVVSEDEFHAPYNPIKCGILGDVAITEHAVERYQERNDSGDMRSPLRSLLRRLSNENLVQIPLSQEVIEYKNKKYGPENDIEVWGHDSSDVSFLLLNKDDHKILLTVFIKPKLQTIQEQARDDLRKKQFVL